MGADLDAELNPYYCTHCRCRISRRESNANNGLCEACAQHARSRAQEAEQEEQARRERPPATTPFAPGAAEVPLGGDAPFDAWLITVGCQQVRLFWFLSLFIPFLSWFAGVVYLALGWLSMPHCQTEAGRRAADRIVASATRMCWLPVRILFIAVIVAAAGGVLFGLFALIFGLTP